jgi:tetratricopeptide (TPR) repeat protein
MKSCFALLSLCCILATAQAQVSCDPTPDALVDTAAKDRIRQLLKEKKFGAVEDELGDKLKRYERGAYSDLALYTTIYEAMDKQPALEPILAQWVNEQPRSSMARLLRAAYHVSAGYAKRGGERANKTSLEQFAAMRAEFDKALSELEVSLRLRPNSALPRALLIEIARSTVGPDAVRALLLDAERLDPSNQAARQAAVFALEPRWGGSLEDLDAMALRWSIAPISAPRLRFLQYRVELQKGSHFYVFAKEKSKALVHYRRAARICTSADALWRASHAAYDLEDWDASLEVLDELLRLSPDRGTAWERRGWAKEKLGRTGEAIRDYEKAAAMGEAWSQAKFGSLLMTGAGVPKDLDRARQLLEAAAAKGDSTARHHLDYLNRQTLGK